MYSGAVRKSLESPGIAWETGKHTENVQLSGECPMLHGIAQGSPVLEVETNCCHQCLLQTESDPVHRWPPNFYVKCHTKKNKISMYPIWIFIY